MDINEYVNKAEEYFMKGYNCSQSVSAAFADVVHLPEDLLLKISCPLGGGLARLRYVCGAVTGMSMILGLVYSSDAPDAKASIYPKTRELTDKFEDKFGTIVCSDLLKDIVSHDDSPVPEERTAAYYQKRKCLDCIRTATQILAEDLKEHEYI